MIAFKFFILAIIGVASVQGFFYAAENGCPERNVSRVFEHEEIELPDIVHSGSYGGQICEINDNGLDTTSLTKRDNPRDMVNNARYSWSTWVVLIQGFALDYYSRSTWVLPPDDGGINWLASSVAYSITQAGHTTWINTDIGGGWQLHAVLGSSDHYSFQDIPFGLLVMLVKSACYSAQDWVLGYDNGFHFQMWSSDLRDEIISLTVLPSSN